MNLNLREPSKSFMAPVWIMSAIAIIRFVLGIISTITTRQLQLRHNTEVNKITFLITWFFFTLAVAEAIIYWRIRNRNYNRRWVWTHLILMIICMAVLPLIFIALYPLLIYFMNGSRVGEIYMTVNRWRLVIFFGCLLMGTGFFVANAVKSFEAKGVSIEDSIDAIGTHE